MADRFQLFRLSCLARPQIDAFEIQDPTREAFLRRVLMSRWEFGHYGSRFYYEPDAEHSTPEVLIGRLGRRVIVDENLPPEQHLEEARRETWHACLLVVDPTDHPDGQKAAIEIDKTIGGAPALMGALTKEVNARGPVAPFVLEAQPIFDAASFWEFAEQNRGRVTSLTFDLVAPNGLWNTDKTLKQELAELRNSIKTQQVITTFKSPDGLETNTERIREAVDYAEKGSGKIRAQARGKRFFNSTDKPKVVTLDDQPAAREPLISRVTRALRVVLGRE